MPSNRKRKGALRPYNKVLTALESIRKHCLWCMGGNVDCVRECWDPYCWLYPFRNKKLPKEEDVEVMIELQKELERKNGDKLRINTLRKILLYMDNDINSLEQNWELVSDLYELRMGERPGEKELEDIRELKSAPAFEFVNFANEKHRRYPLDKVIRHKGRTPAARLHIKRWCKECMGWEGNPKKCPNKDCWLWPWRTGKTPKKKKRRDKKEVNKKRRKTLAKAREKKRQKDKEENEKT